MGYKVLNTIDELLDTVICPECGWSCKANELFEAGECPQCGFGSGAGLESNYDRLLTIGEIMKSDEYVCNYADLALFLKSLFAVLFMAKSKLTERKYAKELQEKLDAKKKEENNEN